MKSFAKRTLATVLCAVMLLSCWVFTAPTASAANETPVEDYYVEIDVKIVYKQTSFTSAYTGPFFTSGNSGYKDMGGITVFFKDENGTKDETAANATVGKGNSYDVNISNADTAYTAIKNYGIFDGKRFKNFGLGQNDETATSGTGLINSTGKKTISSTISGFPTSFAVYNNNDNNGVWGAGATYTDWEVNEIRIGKNADNMVPIWQGKCRTRNSNGDKPARFIVEMDGTAAVWNPTGAYSAVTDDVDTGYNGYCYVYNYWLEDGTDNRTAENKVVAQNSSYNASYKKSWTDTSPYVDSVGYTGASDNIWNSGLEIGSDSTVFLPNGTLFCKDQYGVKIQAPSSVNYGLTTYDYASYGLAASDLTINASTGAISAAAGGFIAGNNADHAFGTTVTYFFGSKKVEGQTVAASVAASHSGSIHYPTKTVNWKDYGASQNAADPMSIYYGNTIASVPAVPDRAGVSAGNTGYTYNASNHYSNKRWVESTDSSSPTNATRVVSDLTYVATDDSATHTYDQEVATSDYLASAATCSAQASYYKSCVCGKVDPNEHTFTSGGVDADNHNYSDAWTYDASNHWHACTLNAEHKTDTASHSTANQPWVSDGTNHWKTCNVCGYGPLESAAHNWAYTNNGATHRKYCSECGYDTGTTAEAHTYDQTVVDDAYLVAAANCSSPAIYRKSCKCGATDPSAATFPSGAADASNHIWKTDGEGNTLWVNKADGNGLNATGNHYKECDLCGTKVDETHSGFTKIADVPGSCTVNGYKQYKCGTCAYTYTEYPAEYAATGHTAESGYHTDGSNHWKTCTVCGEIAVAATAHVYNQQSVKDETTRVSDATCTLNAVYKQTCVCGVICPDETSNYEATGTMLAHIWDGGHEYTPANCTTKGVTEYTCTRGCGGTKYETDIPLDPTNHSYTDDSYESPTLYREAICVEGPRHYYNCSRCHECEENAAHTYVSGAAVAGNHSYATHLPEPTDGANADAEASLKYEYCTNEGCGKRWAYMVNVDSPTGESISQTPIDVNEGGSFNPTGMVKTPSPTFNNYTLSDGASFYQYKDRKASMKLNSASGQQEVRFAGSVQIPAGVEYNGILPGTVMDGADVKTPAELEAELNGNALHDNEIIDFGFVLTLDTYLDGSKADSANGLHGDLNNLVINPSNTKIARMSVPATNAQRGNTAGLDETGSNWSGVTVRDNGDTGAGLKNYLTFNLLVSIVQKNWTKEYCCRAYIIYKYNGVVHTVYDGYSTVDRDAETGEYIKAAGSDYFYSRRSVLSIAKAIHNVGIKSLASKTQLSNISVYADDPVTEWNALVGSIGYQKNYVYNKVITVLNTPANAAYFSDGGDYSHVSSLPTFTQEEEEECLDYIDDLVDNWESL